MKDILLDKNFDLQIVGNDFVIGDSTQQNQQALLVTNKGEFRTAPKVGVGVIRAVLDDSPGSIKGEIIEQFEADGMTISALSVSHVGAINIDASYE